MKCFGRSYEHYDINQTICAVFGSVKKEIKGDYENNFFGGILAKWELC